MVALVDCGCEATIISNPCADKLGVKRNPVGNQAEHWDGTLTSLEEVDAPLTMEIGDNVRHEIQQYISHAVAYDLILGIDWLCYCVQSTHQLATKPFDFTRYEYSTTIYH
jgi:gag-polyprotein putative aspartyl protease